MTPRIDRLVECFRDPMHEDPEQARGACFMESQRFARIIEAAAEAAGLDVEVVSGVQFAPDSPSIILNGHAATRVGDQVYDWTARQFWPHDQDVPLVQPLAVWRETWADLREGADA